MASPTLRKTILGQYLEIAKLGSGTFGSVYKCKDIKTGAIVAIKKFKKHFDSHNEAFN
jgi:serine/threonine protein kinase